METNYNYIDVYPVLIEKLTEVNIFKDSTGLFFAEKPQIAETINSIIKGYELVLVRTDQCNFENEYNIEDIEKLGDEFFKEIVVEQIVAYQNDIPEEYIQTYINEYNSNTVKNIRIESAEYFANDIGDKVQIKKSIAEYKEGDIITINGFGNNIGDKVQIKKSIAEYKEGDIITINGFGNNRIFFEEDDEENQGIHISYLDLPTYIFSNFDNDKKVIILKEDDNNDNERKYTLKELKDFAKKNMVRWFVWLY